MAIHFKCANPECGRPMRAPDGTEGRKATCPFCNTLQTVPQPQPEPEDDFIELAGDESLPEELDSGLSQELGQFEEKPAAQSADQQAAEPAVTCSMCSHAIPPGMHACPSCGNIEGAGLADAANQKESSGIAAVIIVLGVLVLLASVAGYFLMKSLQRINTSPSVSGLPTAPVPADKPAVVPPGDKATVRPSVAKGLVIPKQQPSSKVKAESLNRMHRIGTSLVAYGTSHGGKYPDSMENLGLGQVVLHSPADPARRYVYVPGRSLDSPDDIVVYDPVVYGGKVLALAAGGDLREIPHEEIERVLKPATE